MLPCAPCFRALSPGCGRRVAAGVCCGLELLDIVKKNKVMTTKIVMISAKGQYDDVVAAAKLRCNAYIIKPFTRQHLLDTIKTVLESE